MRLTIASLLLLTFISIAPNTFAAQCEGRAYTSVDDGYFAYSKVKAQYVGEPLYTSYGGRHVQFIFESDRKSRWKIYRDSNQTEILQGVGYYSPSIGINLSDLRFDEVTINHLRGRVVVGLNLFCRI